MLDAGERSYKEKSRKIQRKDHKYKSANKNYLGHL